MLKRNFGLALFVFVVLGGCSVNPISTSFDPDSDFSGVQTFAWMPGDWRAGQRRMLNPQFVHDEITGAIEGAFSERGLSRQDRVASVWVAYYAGLDKKVTVSDRFYDVNIRRGGQGITVTNEFDRGTLAIDIIDPQSKKLIWRGIAQKKVELQDSKQVKSEKINEVVRQILEEFPPA